MSLLRALVVFVFVLLAPALAFAQDTPAGPPTFMTGLPQWVYAAVGVVIALGVLSKAVAFLLGGLSEYWPGLKPVAAGFANASTEIHNWGARLAAVLPGSATKMAARRAAKVVPPLAGMLLCGWLVSGCAWSQAHPAFAADLQKVEDCVEPILVADEAAGDTPLTIGIDIGAKCGSLAVQVVNDAAAKAAAKRLGAKTKAHLLLRASR